MRIYANSLISEPHTKYTLPIHYPPQVIAMKFIYSIIIIIIIIDKQIILNVSDVSICQPLSPVCWRMWLTRCSFLVNDLEQKPHRCGDSPVCCRTWFNRCSFLVNVLEQKSQRWGVSPVCHIMWFVKCSFLVNDLPLFYMQKKEEKKKKHFFFSYLLIDWLFFFFWRKVFIWWDDFNCSRVLKWFEKIKNKMPAIFSGARI